MGWDRSTDRTSLTVKSTKYHQIANTISLQGCPTIFCSICAWEVRRACFLSGQTNTRSADWKRFGPQCRKNVLFFFVLRQYNLNHISMFLAPWTGRHFWDSPHGHGVVELWRRWQSSRMLALVCVAHLWNIFHVMYGFLTCFLHLWHGIVGRVQECWH